MNLRALGVSVFLLAASGLPLHAQAWGDYNNTRFGYYVSYPTALLRALPEAGNGDGREFRARKGTGSVRVWGQWFTPDDGSPQHRAQEAGEKCAGGKPAYRLDRPTVQVLSCAQTDGTVLYYKALYRKDVVVTLEATYPAADKATWDPAVAKMAKSMLSLGSPFDDE